MSLVLHPPRSSSLRTTFFSHIEGLQCLYVLAQPRRAFAMSSVIFIRPAARCFWILCSLNLCLVAHMRGNGDMDVTRGWRRLSGVKTAALTIHLSSAIVVVRCALSPLPVGLDCILDSRLSDLEIFCNVSYRHLDIPTSLAPQIRPLVPGDNSIRSVVFLESTVLRSGWFRWGVILCGVALHAKCLDTDL